MYRGLSYKTADILRAMSRKDKNMWIHDAGDGIDFDPYRMRAIVPDATARQLMETLMVFNRTYFPGSSLVDVRFLKSQGGAPDLLPRREFPPVSPEEERLNVCSVPGIFFIATQNSTYVYGWNQHVPVKSKQQIVELNKGDILMLRGDCIYAMAGGETTNRCIQAYVDVPLYARPAYQVPEIVSIHDDTRDADDMVCFAWNCPFVSGTTPSLYKHLNNYHHFYFNQPREIVP